MDSEEQRDHAEEAENKRILETGDGESYPPDQRMLIEIRQWSTERNAFEPFEEWVIEEPYVYREAAEWFGIVTTHIRRNLPVGIYAFALHRSAALVAQGEFAWDGRVATRREGASAP